MTTETRPVRPRAEMTLEDAIRIVAHRVLIQAATVYIDYELWGDYPELGEGDWNAVQEKAIAMATRTPAPDAKYEQAYALLAARAVGQEA